MVDKSEEDVALIISHVRENALTQSDIPLVIQCIELAVWMPKCIESKNISLSRFRTLLFGKSASQRRKKKSPSVDDKGNLQNPENKGDGPQPSIGSSTEPLTTGSETNAPIASAKKAGHGRMPHDVYQDSMKVTLTLNGYTVNQSCPYLCPGKLRDYQPGVLIRIRGQNFASVTEYKIEKLRCDTCGYLFVANIPSHIGEEKYDYSFKALVVLQKYYVAVPFYRQQSFQALLGFPLSDATQWDLVEQVATPCYGVLKVLTHCAANGKTIGNDDTRLKILEVMREIKADPNRDRKGMYTSGFIAEFEGHMIALFRNGTQHAGENLNDILKHRQTERGPIIQMCDASGNNTAKDFKTILCHCLSHGFRKFEELVDYFPVACVVVMEKIHGVYQHDEATRNLSDSERLLYHQQHSRPIMDELKAYIDEQLSSHKVEPNSELGKALLYMNKYWSELTQFLCVAGAKLDNNVVERALKIAIRNRKSAMFYRSRYSADIGGMLTSLIYTCHLADENPHHYLTALQAYKVLVHKHPEQWLPWNYRETLSSMTDEAACANPLGHGPPEGRLAVV